jgi:hypothetical protein
LLSLELVIERAARQFGHLEQSGQGVLLP